jgi:predicted  nucleic acid-binding Zn-ribbon protein
MTGFKYTIALSLLAVTLSAGAQSLKDGARNPVGSGVQNPGSLNRVTVPDSESLDNILNARRLEYSKVEAEVRKLKVDSANLTTKIQEASQKVEANAGCKPVVNGLLKKLFSREQTRMECSGKGDPKDFESAKRDFADLTKQKDQIDARVATLNTSLPRLEAEVNKLQDAVTAQAEKKDEYQKKLLADLIAKTKIDGLLAETEKEFHKLGKQMDGLEAFFDQLNMAYYMRVKMEKLINSPEMCDRVKSCGSSTDAPSKIKLQNLFTEGSPARSVSTPDGQQ